MTLRVAAPGDLQRLHDLLAAEPQAAHWTPGQLAAFVSRATAVCLCAEEKGAVCGLIAGSVLITENHPAEAELENLVVAPAFRRSGVGRLLLAAFLDWCVGQAVEVVRLEVRSSNVAALRLYAGYGFAQRGVRRGYYRDPEDDAVLMELRFDSAGVPGLRGKNAVRP